MSARRFLRNFRTCRSGASALEFALVLPVFVLMVMGSISASLLGMSVASMNYAVEDAARCAAVNKTLCPTPTATALYAQSKYVGPAIAPSFAFSTAGCGNTVSASATYRLALLPEFASVPLFAEACHPSA